MRRRTMIRRIRERRRIERVNCSTKHEQGVTSSELAPRDLTRCFLCLTLCLGPLKLCGFTDVKLLAWPALPPPRALGGIPGSGPRATAQSTTQLAQLVELCPEASQRASRWSPEAQLARCEASPEARHSTSAPRPGGARTSRQASRRSQLTGTTPKLSAPCSYMRLPSSPCLQSLCRSRGWTRFASTHLRIVWAWRTRRRRPASAAVPGSMEQ
jgi:hypothetical protein